MKRESTLILILFLLQCYGSQLLKKDDFWYIPGKGCGISTEIKYLTEIPQNIEGRPLKYRIPFHKRNYPVSIPHFLTASLLAGP